ncbi:hypothetical protein HNP32_003636 [Brevundimonas bullata]|uniref:Lysophospholipase n=1 Tax=Brevundimonas bullata TaxID=13160 RepID=A0A7W7ITV9_9CAUL|nr:DUF1489 domain-containing protein [Brevundimonas bullata]MBB4799875.1 hypothetical protein [Brevundimonas bullata]MBB6384834.1 hypothetical protein [Brevundimonas bullata]
MPLHMIKLCVGVSEVETLEANAARSDWRIVHTRMTPKRAAEIEDGGSLYWVMKGSVTCRQRILDITTVGEGKESRCEIKLDSQVIRTAPLARRPFQGWRYFEPKDAPPDLSVAEATDLPDDLARELRELGAW